MEMESVSEVEYPSIVGSPLTHPCLYLEGILDTTWRLLQAYHGTPTRWVTVSENEPTL